MHFTEHPDYTTELKRLEDTMAYLEKVIAAIEESRNIYNEDIKDAFKSLDPSDSSLSYMSIMLNTKLLDQLEKNYRSYKNVRRKPYFARIDIKQEGETAPEQLYIGKASLFKEDMEPVIIDWRAPIASVYYDGRLGPVAYKTTEEIIEAELFLKRQYTIQDGQLENMMDIDITANDAFLQASLSGYANDRLKDIASTIQAEQNAIIRADLDKTLVVQGVAGSGKTTIALHRIAYLIYTFEDKFDPDEFMIIAPNRLFLNYIADVLPELGVEKVRQTTYIDFVFELIGHKYNLTPQYDQLLELLESENGDSSVAAFKGSLKFRDILDRYTTMIEQDFVPDEDLYVNNLLIASAKEINHVFLHESHYSAIFKRLTKIKKFLNSTLKAKIHAATSRIDAKYEVQIQLLRVQVMDAEERRSQITALIDERDGLLNKINNASKNAVAKYMTKFPKKKLLEYYEALITNPKLMKSYSRGHLEEDLITKICSHSASVFAQKKVELEDLAALLYLHGRLFGLSEKMEVRYVVIDEAQDFSLFQFYALKAILNTERFTILGDLSQGIHSYKAIKDWESVLEGVFVKDKSTYLTLEQSYRTTIEIMEVANKVISLWPSEGLLLAKPVVRHGEAPELLPCNSKDFMLKAIERKLAQFKKEAFKSIALIGKTLKECQKIHKALQQNKVTGIALLDGKDDSYHHEVVIVPSYLAKGLEFDAVMIISFEEYFNEDELDVKLLYVAMTRALHRVSIFYLPETQGILKYLS